AAEIGIAQMRGLLHFAGEGIDLRQLALVALWRPVAAARAHVPALVLFARRELTAVGDVLTGGHRRDVEKFRSRAVGGRPEVGAAHPIWAQPRDRLVRRRSRDARIGLHILVGIVVEWLARLLVDTLGPVDVVHIGLGEQDLSVAALERVG